MVQKAAAGYSSPSRSRRCCRCRGLELDFLALLAEFFDHVLNVRISMDRFWGVRLGLSHTAKASGFIPFSIMEMQMESVRRSRWVFCLLLWSVNPGFPGTVCLLPTNQKCGNLMKDVDCLLGGSLLLSPFSGWHLGRPGVGSNVLLLMLRCDLRPPREARLEV